MTKAWVAGGSGLVGTELLRALGSDSRFESIVSVGRRTLGLTDPKIIEHKVDFAAPSSFESLPAADVAFSCLGTTIKVAGSKEAFRAVDFDAVLTFAKAAHDKGARTFVHVSSLGADPEARSFYFRVKGELEQAVTTLGYDSVYALRPSLLDGDRRESRPLERIGIWGARTFAPLLGSYAPNKVSDVARTMILAAATAAPGAHFVPSKAITKGELGK